MMVKAAVIGIGSNSVRMLVFEHDGQNAVRLRRDRAGTRLFDGLDQDGNLSQAAMETTAAAVAEMAAAARAEGAEEVRLFATSATRDARNNAEFAAMLKERADVEMEVFSGELEAAMSFIGATDGGFSGVIDIGGGSTELITGTGMKRDIAFSCQMGAVRLCREMPISCAADTEAVCAHAAQLLHEKLDPLGEVRLPENWFGTGGTFTTIAAILNHVSWMDRSKTHGMVLLREKVQKTMLSLADMPISERLLIPGLQPKRADIIVHGVCILYTLMKELDIEELKVSEYGNMDGFVIDRYGVTLTGHA